MKRLHALLALAAAALPAWSAEPDVAGEWWTPGFAARVRIEPCGDALCGRIVWLWDESARDAADKAPLLGRLVIERMRTAEPGRWAGGRLYNPEDGRDYKGTLQLKSAHDLEVAGCFGPFCQTQLWRRAVAEHCPPVARR